MSWRVVAAERRSLVQVRKWSSSEVSSTEHGQRFGRSSWGGRPRRKRTASLKFVSEIVNSLVYGRVVIQEPAFLVELLRSLARGMMLVSSDQLRTKELIFKRTSQQALQTRGKARVAVQSPEPQSIRGVGPTYLWL